jgi:hypothetical protein
MTKTKAFIALGLALLVAAYFLLQYRNDFARINRVEITNASVRPDTLPNILLTNNSSGKVEFPLRCYHKVGSGKPLFTKVVVLQPGASVEFNVNPEHADRPLPSLVASKGCEAIWRGPFGMERVAWQFDWQFGRPMRKRFMS